MKKEIIYEKSTLNHSDPQELIEVDNESSFYPNIEQDGKEYCRMTYGKNIHCKSLKVFNPAYYEKSELHSLQEHHYPFRVWLGGKDDDSWTKYFPTEEAMLKEVERLRKKQPINKHDDVIENGYFFTN